MKKLMMALMSVLFIGSLALAAEGENMNSDKTTESKNPITGTKTVTHKKKKKMKGEKGEETAEATTKTKEMKDGSTSATTETKTETDKK